MKHIEIKDVERLEKISLALEKISQGKRNPILNDMKWLTEELRRTYRIIEESIGGHNYK
jgi:hypothetical protein